MENVIFEKNATAKLAQKAKDFRKILIITSPSTKKQYFQMLSNFLNENKSRTEVLLYNRLTLRII